MQARFPNLKIVTLPSGLQVVPSVYSSFPATQQLGQALRPYPQWNGIPPFLGPPNGNTWYDSLQIQGRQRFSHGLGVGDMNGDGRPDVMCTGGWWENPEKDDGVTPWKFHAADLGPACSDMHAYDLDGDGKMDVLSSSAHGFGIWWHQQRVGKDGKATFFRQELYKDLIAQTHALVVADINGDGVKDFVTGCRWWAHGPKGDAGERQVPVLYWFEGKKSKDGMITFTPHLIDNESGVGTQFVVTDLDGDGLPDVVVSNKNGVFAYLQVRGK